MHIAQLQTLTHTGSAAGHPSRAAASTGMISSCRITLPLDRQDFSLSLLSRNFLPERSKSGPRGTLASSMNRIRIGAAGSERSSMTPLGGGVQFSGFQQFLGRKKKEAEF